MGRIIVIDGTSNAGKTTLCENLEKNVKNIVIIPGASMFAKMNSEKYPQTPPIPKNKEEEIKNQSFFYNLELDRLIQANKLAQAGKDVIMDRGILEILSVAYSFEKINNWDGIFKNAVKLYGDFLETVNKKQISLPDKNIWLQANYEEILRRNESRKCERGRALSETEWISKELIDLQIDFFSRICNKYDIQFIDTNFSGKKEVCDDAIELLNLRKKEREEER